MKKILPVIVLIFIFDINRGQYCKKLHDLNNPEPRYMYIYAAIRKIVIMSTSRSPSMATASLLATTLRHRYGYLNVETRLDNRTNCELAATIPELIRQNGTEYDEQIIYIDADWSGPEEQCSVQSKGADNPPMIYNMAGLRLEPIGGAIVNTAWHVVLTTNSTLVSKCSKADKFYFYQNINNIESCGFSINRTTNESFVELLIPTDIPMDDIKISELLKHYPYLKQQKVNRKELNEKINRYPRSFLFVDYGLWKNEEFIKIIEEAPIVSREPLVSLRLVDSTFIQYAPIIMGVLSSYVPEPKTLREIMELNIETNNYDEASCRWTIENANNVKSITWMNIPDQELRIGILLCADVKNSKMFNKIKQSIVNIITLADKRNKQFNYGYYIIPDPVDCHDTHGLGKWFTRLSNRLEWQSIVGVVAAGSGAAEAAATVKDIKTHLILYDVVPTKTRLQTSANSSTGNLESLSRAINHFFKKQNWKRVAIIYEPYPLALDLVEELLKESTIEFKRSILESVDELDVRNVLEYSQKCNTRIIFLNVEADVGSKVICEAKNLGMTKSAGYAWVAREWYTSDACTEGMEVYSVSYFWRGGNRSVVNNEIRGDEELLTKLDEVWGNEPWPPLLAPLADALIMMRAGVDGMLRKHPERRYDVHAFGTISVFNEELTNPRPEILGVTQKLRQNNNALDKPLIFVTKWEKDVNLLLSIWRSENSSIIELKNIHRAFEGEPPHDGSKTCWTQTSGDRFNPNCNDVLWLTFAITMALAIVSIWIAIKTRKRRLKERDQQFLHQIFEIKREAEKKLADKEMTPMRMVERKDVRLFEQIGSGHYGLVRSGLLKLPNRDVPELVAVKELRKNATEVEKAEFLREANTLAIMAHENIVRLVGVCAGDNEPPWLLTEQAFFKDLRNYLHERHYLMLTTVLNTSNLMQNTQWAEARHVSPNELTRLAREAVTALVYLQDRKIIHCDLRAANCLVDSTRTLKLADFGLARFVGGTDEPEPRLAAFPACWMAPESINDREFSFASDVWALGVLMLEIVTLGAPPYDDNWPVRKVLEYVKAGGRPPLPRDVSMHTQVVTDMCWDRDPTRRATARQVLDYLTTYPNCLMPAYREPDYKLTTLLDHQRDRSDSGFGASDTNNDWPLPTQPCISTI